MHSHLTPLSDVADETEFFRGKRFRRYQAGMLNVEKDADYYEYMLIDNGDPYMLLANISSAAGVHKAGAVICYVQKSDDVDRVVVTASTLKYSMGVEHIFVVDS